jgi:hypothetical protein
MYKEPGVTLLARTLDGASVQAGAARGDWTAVTLEGWVRRTAVERSRRDGYDFVVRPGSTAPLAAEPDGAARARLQPGLLLDSVGGRGEWLRVRRSGWVASSALTAPAAAAAAGARPAAPRDTARAAPPDSAKPAAQASRQPAAAPRAAGPDRVEAARATPMQAAPGANQPVGTLQPGVPAAVVARAGEWVKVQVEGWVREADLQRAEGGALTGVTAAELRASPERYVGQTVEWRVQFISTQVADELRPELPAGQPYLLVRGPLPEPGFVYVALRRDQLPEFRALQPLHEVVIRAVVRTASTRYLPTPVVELVSMRPIEPVAR